MVKIYPNAEFEADFPDDSEEEDGDIVVFPGRNVAEAISKILERAGYECRGPLADSVHWGYHLAYQKRRSMWFGVSTFEDGEYHLFAEDASHLDRWLPSAKKSFVAYLRMLGRELAADPRFRNLRWFADKDRRHEKPVAFPVEDD